MDMPHWNGWGVGSTQHRFQPSSMAGLSAEDVPRLKLKWAFGFPDAARAFAQPTVVGGKIFVGSQRGKVYSLNASTGCTHWEFGAGAPVRSAIVVGQYPGGWAAYFGDQRANVYAVDTATGKALWQARIEDHPAAIITGSPTLVGTTLFVPVSSYEELTATNPRYACCSFRGSLVALDALTGHLLWKRHTIGAEPKPGVANSSGTQRVGPSGAAIWSAPTFDASKHMVYVTTGDNYSDPPTDTSDAILAFRAETGELAWSRQMTQGDAFNIACNTAAQANCPRSKGPDHDFGSSAILVELPSGRRALVGTQKSGVVTALDPDRDGDIIWQTRVGHGGSLGGVQWGAATDQSKLYVAVSDAKLNVVAPGTPGARLSAVDPNFALLLDSTVSGGLHALDLAAGDVVWHTSHPGCHAAPGCSPAQSAAVTAIPGVVFSGGLDGHLRAYSAADGSIIWDVDTKAEYQTVNGVMARGGSIDGPGAVVVGGMLYVGSGSGLFGTMPGNVLLAFSVEGR
ncbi:outer membrane protein assembly factor BamB family protein [Paracraurococcus lichenis]|uniref:PQQ-binding-like beta-propeller repeat protein n=1 Tax=Paracraurococcus lichenis TaxID=3064888 RepID=A0ABT9EBT2_9PROT|nr:PQQ-binding-like beta-propeller repeat protein [Paracraurococcus sp. LOR1-02]MDO9713355.1 PQQ-binding-like beta-propeller repeat protein [Paracraurococcus sp. LOR1-02]